MFWLIFLLVLIALFAALGVANLVLKYIKKRKEKK